MIVYLLKFSACLLIFLSFYKLVLEKENMHVFKRFFLLGALVLSIGIPFVTFTQYVDPTALTFDAFAQDITLTNNIVETETSTNYLPYIIWSIYIIGVVLFGFKFIRNLYRLNYKIKHNPKQNHFKFTHVLLKDLIVPHTFFNYIFFNKTKFEANDIPEEVFWHEQTHATQKHSIDVVFIELLQMFLWFNPLIYIIKHAIKLNHEFLADQGVLRKGINTNTYQEIILAFSSNASQPLPTTIGMANAINYSLIKKRFTVMKTKTTKRGIWLRSLILLPLLAILLYSFSDTKVIEKDIAETSNILFQDFNTNNEGVTEAMMKEYNDFIESFEETNIIFMGKYNRAIAIYDMMTIKQRESVKDYPKAGSINLAKVKAKKPTENEFNSWKNKKEFAIWIDGKHVDNSKLNSYSIKDISHYSGSFVYNNARSEKFPQAYQYHLYTKKGFENTFTNSNINKYKSQAKKYTDALNIWLKGNRTDNFELRILKAQADKVYASLLKKNIEKHNILQTPPLPSLSKSNSQQKATKEQIKEYNKLAKKYNNMSKDEMHVKKSDFERLKYIYSIMTAAQKKNAEPFPNIPPPPPPASNAPRVIEVEAAMPPPPPLIPVNATPKQKAKYKKVIAEYAKKHPKSVSKYKSKSGDMIEVVEIPTNLLPPPPPPPMPDNATPAQKKKYKENIKKYELAVAESRQNMARVREQKEAYVARKTAMKEEKLARVTEMKQRQEKLEQEKMKHVAKREAITEERREKLAKEKLKHVEERQAEIEKRQEKLAKEKLKHVEERKALAKQKRVIEGKLKRKDERLVGQMGVPNPPKSPLDHVIEMAKKDAIFYFDGKEISSDEAIKKLKKKNKMNIRTISRDSNKPKVYLSTKPIVIEKN